MGKIVIGGGKSRSNRFRESTRMNYVDKVSCKEVITYGEGEGKKRVVLVDCGVKHNIIRCLLKRNVTVIRVPWDYDFNTLNTTACSSATVPATRIPAMRPFRISAKRSPETNRSAVSAWVTNCWQKPEAPPSTN